VSQCLQTRAAVALVLVCGHVPSTQCETQHLLTSTCFPGSLALPAGNLTLRQQLKDEEVSEEAIDKLSAAGFELDGEEVGEVFLDLTQDQLLQMDIRLMADRANIMRVVKLRKEGENAGRACTSPYRVAASFDPPSPAPHAPHTHAHPTQSCVHAAERLLPLHTHQQPPSRPVSMGTSWSPMLCWPPWIAHHPCPSAHYLCCGLAVLPG
jgi:hypothetical protein